MPSQTEAGKAFEYALLSSLFEQLKTKTNVQIVKDKSYTNVKNCYNKFDSNDQTKYNLAAQTAVYHLCDLEPRLFNSLTGDIEEELELSIVPDKQAIKGDVRDILAVRRKFNWEIGISAKNQHRAVKHSRLSDTIDFGTKWLGISCSSEYFKNIQPIFGSLRLLKNQNRLWVSIPNKEKKFYKPVLDAFLKELLLLDKNNPGQVPKQLLRYLIGHNDFYKVIKEKKSTTLQAFNFNGTLNKASNVIKPKYVIPRIHFPNKIISLNFKNGSLNTLILILDKGWQISFRIHSAKKAVEPSLKFDINLIGQPSNLYTHHLYW